MADGLKTLGRLNLVGANIAGNIYLDDARLGRSRKISILGDGAIVRGTAFLGPRLLCRGEIRLLGAEVGGNIDCRGCSIVNATADAFSVDGAKVGGSLYLCRGFTARGAVNLAEANVTGVVSFEQARLSKKDGFALDARGLCAQSKLIWRALTSITGGVSFQSARTGSLSDDWQSWSMASSLVLDGFVYDRISEGPVSARIRTKWLKKDDGTRSEVGFSPQPWEHLAKVLREIGHPEEAKLISMEKQREMRRQGLVGSRRPNPALNQPFRALDLVRVATLNAVSRLLHRSYGALAGYGYRPLRTFMLMTSLWLVAAGAFSIAERRGLFVPSAPSLLTSRANEACGLSAERKSRWTRCAALPRDYTTFDPLMYSLDAILPLVDLKQEGDWEPVVRRGKGWEMWDGLLVRGIMWVEILFGWIGSLLLVSALGRLVQKD